VHWVPGRCKWRVCRLFARTRQGRVQRLYHLCAAAPARSDDFRCVGPPAARALLSEFLQVHRSPPLSDVPAAQACATSLRGVHYTLFIVTTTETAAMMTHPQAVSTMCHQSSLLIVFYLRLAICRDVCTTSCAAAPARSQIDSRRVARLQPGPRCPSSSGTLLTLLRSALHMLGKRCMSYTPLISLWPPVISPDAIYVIAHKFIVIW
jgi:hypothetical protein